MSLLGFDALGRLALGQLPSITSGPSFSKFSEPSRKTPVAVIATTYVGFVPTPVKAPVAVFTPFSAPTALQRPTGSFVYQPVVVTTLTPVFSRFSEPSFVKVRPQSDPSSNLFQAPVAATVVTGGDFADFDLVQAKKGQQQDFTGFVFVPPVVTPVFTQFSQPQAKGLVKEGGVATADVVTVVTVVQPYVFSEYSQPRFRSQAYLQPDVQNELLRPGAATPANLGTFSPFDQPQGKTVKEGYVTNTAVILQQNTVFGRFDQPFAKKVLQQDGSFVNLPVVTVVTQPYVFTSFSQPIAAKSLGEGGIAYNGQVVVTATIQPYVFSLFEQPQLRRSVNEGLVSNSFFLFQPYVFGQFSQPQIGRNYREGFTNAPFVASSQNYLFSTFAQPQFKQVLQVDQSFVNLPVLVVAQQPYLFSPFEQPRFRTSPQLDSAVQFEIIPPPPVISVVVFTGFSDFSTQQLKKQLTAALQSSISYDIIIPVIPVDGFAGKWHKLKGSLKPDVIKLDSSNIAEIVHNKNSNELTVKFQNDKVYHYNNIDEKKVKGLVRAKSSGRYLHNNIKGKYFTTRIK